MKAWLFKGAGEPLQLIEQETPRPGRGEVVIDVRATGLCASDVHLIQGKHAELLEKMPLVLGHETAGVLCAVGEGVEDFKVGDRVVISGTATYTPGFHADGGYASHTLTRAETLRHLPDDVSFEQGAVATDAGQTSYGAVMLAGNLQPGMKVGIVGLGGLGMTAARIAVVNGAGAVYGAEPRREVWDTARGLGVTDVVEDVKSLAQFDLDLIIDFAGTGKTTGEALAAIKFRGTVVLIAATNTEAWFHSPDLIRKELTLRGFQGGQPGSTEAVLAHMQRGELEIHATPITFDQIPDGLDQLAKGGVTGRLVAVQPAG